MRQKLYHFIKVTTIVFLAAMIAVAPLSPVLGLFGLPNQEVVQAATTATNPTSGTIGGGTWNITNGVLTVSNATLPANTSDSSTFWPWTQAGANSTVTSVVFSNVKAPTSASPASIAYLFAGLPNCKTISAPGVWGNDFSIGASNQDQRKLFDGDHSLLSGTVGPFTWSVDKTSGTLTLGGYSSFQLSNVDDDPNFWPWLQVDPNNPDSATKNSITTISINGALLGSTQNQSSTESWSYLFANLPNLTTINPSQPTIQADGVVDISYMFANDPKLAGPIDLSQMKDAQSVVNAKGAFSGDSSLTGVTISSQFGSTQNLVNLDSLFSGDGKLVNIHMAAGATGGQLQESPAAHAYGAFDGCDLSKIELGFSNDLPSDGLSSSLLSTFYGSYYKALHTIHVFVGETWTPSIAYLTDAYQSENPKATSTPQSTWSAASAAGVTESDNGGSNSVKIPPTASTSLQPLGYYDSNNKIKDGTGGNEFSVLYQWPDSTYYSINVDIYAIPKVTLTSPYSGISTVNGKLSDTIPQTTASTTVDISKYLTSVTGYDGKSDTAQASTPVITYTPTGGTAQTVTSVDSSKAGTYTVTWTALDPTSGKALAAGDDPSNPGQFSSATATSTLTLTVAPTTTDTTITSYILTPPSLGSYFIYNEI